MPRGRSSPPTLQCGPHVEPGDRERAGRDLPLRLCVSGARETNASTCIGGAVGTAQTFVCGQHKPRAHVGPTCFSTRTLALASASPPPALPPYHTDSCQHQIQLSHQRHWEYTVSVGKHVLKDTLSRPQ